MRAAADEGAFDIPAAPILIPPGPWKEIDGSVTAPKGFKAQGVAEHRPLDCLMVPLPEDAHGKVIVSQQGLHQVTGRSALARHSVHVAVNGFLPSRAVSMLPCLHPVQ